MSLETLTEANVGQEDTVSGQRERVSIKREAKEQKGGTEGSKSEER